MATQIQFNITSFTLFVMKYAIDFEDLSKKNGMSMVALTNLDVNKIA